MVYGVLREATSGESWPRRGLRRRRRRGDRGRVSRCAALMQLRVGRGSSPLHPRRGADSEQPTVHRRSRGVRDAPAALNTTRSARIDSLTDERLSGCGCWPARSTRARRRDFAAARAEFYTVLYAASTTADHSSNQDLRAAVGPYIAACESTVTAGPPRDGSTCWPGAPAAALAWLDDHLGTASASGRRCGNDAADRRRRRHPGPGQADPPHSEH